MTRISRLSSHPAEVAGHPTDDRTDGRGEDGDGEADLQGDLPAVEDAAQHVLADVVGAQPVLG